MSKLVFVVAGMKRSGSTAQFNMLRLCVEQYVDNYNVCENYEELQDGMVNIVKRHKFCEKLAKEANLIFLTDRDETEIKASLKRFGDKGQSFEDMKEHEGLWRRRLGYCAITMDYLDVAEMPFICIREILQTVQDEIKTFLINEEYDKIKPPKEGQDPKTLLFHNHITSK